MFVYYPPSRRHPGSGLKLSDLSPLLQSYSVSKHQVRIEGRVGVRVGVGVGVRAGVRVRVRVGVGARARAGAGSGSEWE